MLPSSSVTEVRIEIPQGLPHLIHRICKEIIRAQPSNLLDFTATFLEQDLLQRNQQQLPIHHICGHDQENLSQDENKTEGTEAEGTVSPTSMNLSVIYDKDVLNNQQTERKSDSAKFTKAHGENGESQKLENEADLAAIKIQSSYRGYKTRRDMKHAQTTDPDLANQLKPPLPTIKEEEAAKKIQAGVRGYLVRKKMKMSGSTDDSFAQSVSMDYGQSFDENEGGKPLEEGQALQASEIQTTETTVATTNLGEGNAILDVIHDKSPELVEEEMIQVKSPIVETLVQVHSKSSQDESEIEPNVITNPMVSPSNAKPQALELDEVVAQAPIEMLIEENFQHGLSQGASNGDILETSVISAGNQEILASTSSQDSRDVVSALDSALNENSENIESIKKFGVSTPSRKQSESFADAIKNVEEVKPMNFDNYEDENGILSPPPIQSSTDAEKQLLTTAHIEEEQPVADEPAPVDKPLLYENVEVRSPLIEAPVQRRSSKRRTVAGTEKYRSAIVLDDFQIEAPKITNEIDRVVELDAEIESDAQLMNNAAAKIQAGFRGFQVRRSLNNAATRIQSNYRGYKARKNLRNQSNAATKIQASVRGFLTRKKISKFRNQQQEQRRRDSAARRRSSQSQMIIQLSPIRDSLSEE